MTNRPIFVATHPRACSTAFERVFITRRDILECHHEPFGDPFYFGPENLSPRFKEDEAGRVESGYADLTFGDVMDQLLNQKEGKRVFTKDMAYYLFSPQGWPTYLFPSLVDRLPGGKSKEAVEVEVKESGSGGGGGGLRKLLQEPGNPTAVPREMLRKFHFAFLIRHPRRSVPSYYRCHIPPLVDVTGFSEFLPEESGYAELRRLFDFLRGEGMVGPGRAVGEAATNGTTTNGVNGTNGTANGVNGTNGTNGTANGVNGHAEHQQERVPITLVDADDLLDRPEEVVRAFCRDVGIDFQPVMLDWDEESLAQSSEAFKKWDGFHDDALGSTSLKPRTHAQKTKTEAQEDEEWTQKFGAEAAKVIRQTVNDNIEHYEYLKQFKLKI